MGKTHAQIDPALQRALTVAEEQVAAARGAVLDAEQRLHPTTKVQVQLEKAEQQQAAAEETRAGAQQALDQALAEQWHATYTAATAALASVVADVDEKIADLVRDSIARRREWAGAIDAAVHRWSELAAARPPSVSAEALAHDTTAMQDAAQRARAARLSAERRELALEGGNLWR